MYVRNTLLIAFINNTEMTDFSTRSHTWHSAYEIALLSYTWSLIIPFGRSHPVLATIGSIFPGLQTREVFQIKT